MVYRGGFWWHNNLCKLSRIHITWWKTFIFPPGAFILSHISSKLSNAFPLLSCFILKNTLDINRKMGKLYSTSTLLSLNTHFCGISQAIIMRKLHKHTFSSPTIWTVFHQLKLRVQVSQTQHLIQLCYYYHCHVTNTFWLNWNSCKNYS